MISSSHVFSTVCTFNRNKTVASTHITQEAKMRNANLKADTPQDAEFDLERTRILEYRLFDDYDKDEYI